MHSIPAAEDDELAFDLTALEAKLLEEKAVGRGVVLCYGLGEVNTGGFGRNLEDVAGLCRKYGAWLHIDAGQSILDLVLGTSDAGQLLADSQLYCRSCSILLGVWSWPTA